MLVVSRPDIETENVTDFPLNSRFIKLPIINYLKLLGAYDELNNPQIALINAINNPKYRFVCAALARRLGKTFISNVIAQLVTLVPGSNVLIVSPNYNLSAISFELQRSFIKHFELEVERDNLKDKVIELSNGSTIRMGSISTVNACVGRSYDLIIYDEAALSEGGDSAFNVQLRPTLDKVNSKCIFISTPRGKLNWFSTFYNRGFSDLFPEWASLTADYTENSRMSARDVDEARRSMSHAEFQQEYCASFTEFVGQIYTFDSSRYCIPFEMLPDREADYEFIAGCDPGYRDPTAFVAISYLDGVFHVVDEYVDNGTTEKHANAFREYIEKWEIELLFIDSAAAQFGADLTYTYDISTTKSKKDVLPGIAYVQTLIETGRLYVAPHCKHVLAALDQYRWDQREGLMKVKAVHDEHSHIADALRYALYSFTIDE